MSYWRSVGRASRAARPARSSRRAGRPADGGRDARPTWGRCTRRCALSGSLFEKKSPGRKHFLGTRVLIADTDLGLRERLYGRLLDVDIFSDCAGTGPDALEKLDEFRYNLIVADVGLPNHGIEQVVARVARMRREERPIVLVLGSPDATRSLDVEIVQIVLRRPVDLDQLVDLIRSCLRSASGSGRELREGNGDGTHLTS